MQKLPLEILRDDENTVGLARMDFALRTGEVRQHHGDRNVGRGIDPAGEIPACLGAVAVDHRDRHVAQSLVQIGLRIEERVERSAKHHHGERRSLGEDAAKLAAEGVEEPVHKIAPASGCGAAVESPF